MFLFFLHSILLGIGLAMDAFSVSLVNGLRQPDMRRWRRVRIAGMFALFQFLMPVVGWACVHTLARAFTAFQPCIPWIALGLLLWIGGKMLLEGLRGGEEAADQPSDLTWPVLLAQAVATSIDALSVGFTIAEYDWSLAFLCAGVIACVTYLLCAVAVQIGTRCGERLSHRASILGGAILIGIGLEIWIRGVFF